MLLKMVQILLKKFQNLLEQELYVGDVKVL